MVVMIVDVVEADLGTIIVVVVAMDSVNGGCVVRCISICE